MRASRQVPPGLSAVLMVAATSFFVVLVAWATLIGPDEVFTGPGRVERTVTTPTRSCLPLDVRTGADGSVTSTAPDNPQDLPLCEGPDRSRQDAIDIVERSNPPGWVKILVWTFLLAVVVAVVALVVVVLMMALDRIRRRRRGERRVAVEFTALGEPTRLVEAIAEDSAGQDAVIRDGDPRNAIVAAWLRFEVQGESAGVGRRPWETSSEYAIRILDLVAADSGAVNRLAGLYREARFSRHPITEDHRDAAIDALGAIRRSLGARA